MSADTAPAQRDLAGGFAPRTVAILAVAAAGSLLFLVLMLAFGDRLTGRSVSGPSTFSWSAIGHRGIVELLRGYGMGVAAQESRAGRELGPNRPLWVAEPPAHAGRSDLADLAREARRNGAPLVLVLPKWSAAASPRHPGWVGPLHLLPRAAVAAILGDLPDRVWRRAQLIRLTHQDAGQGLACTGLWNEPLPGSAGNRRPAWRLDLAPAQLLAPSPDLEPVVACGAGLLVARHGTDGDRPRDTYVIADPDLLNNRGLGRAGHADLVYHLLSRRLAARGVVFDETAHGFWRSRGPLTQALTPPLLPVTLEAVLVLALILWRGTVRLGRPLHPAAASADGKEVLIANTADLLSQGGHIRDSIERYYRVTIRATAARLFLPADLREDLLVRRLAEIGRARGLRRDPHTIASRIQAAPHLSPEAATALARELYAWRMEMTDGRR